MQSELPLPPPFDRLVSGDVKHIRLAPRDILFRQQATPHALFYVARGAVTLQRHTEAGQTVILHRAQGGDLIAEASLFSPQYHCDCVAESDSLCFALAKPAVLRLMADDPAFATALVQRFAGQVQGYRRQLELRAIRSAKHRVLAGLSDGWHKGSILDFAADMGLTHEATYRALANLVADGKLIKTGRGQYRVISAKSRP